MAANGPSLGVSSLVYSTLGSGNGLGLLPSPERVLDRPFEEVEEAATSAAGDTIDRMNSSQTTEIQCEENQKAKKASSEESKEALGRFYSFPASSFGKKSRLGFKSKSGAGSMSSSEQATLPKQSSLSLDDGALTPTSPVSKQLQSQISPKNSVGEPYSPSTGREKQEVLQRGSSPLGLIPRAATGSEWSKPGKEGVGLSEILEDLDKQAGERQHREKVFSLQRDSMVGKPVCWQEQAISNRHLWHPVDTREACHLADSQSCLQLKQLHLRRQKLKCSACKCLVHEGCVKQLYYEGYCCKETFREVKQKVKETITYHHFLERRKAGGRCRKCEKGFGNWRKFNLRDVVGISCSLCGDSYHTTCFDEGQRREACHMGPLRNLIIPPTWIVKVPFVESGGGASFSGTPDSPISPKGSTRRRTRRSRRKKNDDKASKYFTVKPIASRQHKPLVVFINPKSGGNQGARLLQTFRWLLNPRQVFDLSQGGPEFGLKMFQGVSNIRVMACGGDGTVGWILSILDKLDIRPPPPIAVLPLGTGNDLARVFGWGGGYTDEPIEKILLHVDEGPVEEMDRWLLNVWENPNAQKETDGGAVDDAPLHVINNYFSIGADAQVALEFHTEREANPEKFSSRYKNKFQYTKLGGKDLFLRRFQTLTDHLQLFGDGEDLTEKVQNLKLEAICFLNITSYGAGTNAWGNPSAKDKVFKQQQMDDGKIEIVGFWSSTFPKLQIGMAHGERIAHCQHIKLVTKKAFPIQIDGEACKLQPSVIEVALKNKAFMVRKVARRYIQTPLQGVRPSERIKLSVSKVSVDQYERLHSDLYEIRKIAKALGLVVATSQDTLDSVRKQIEHFASEVDEDGENYLSSKWRYLDVANSGRVDRMFQVTPDQEKTMLIGDMLSDGLLIVEFPSSPPAVDTHPSILLSPEAEGERSIMDSPTTAARKRKLFGRNSSYEHALDEQSSLKGMSPPPPNGVIKTGLEVPSNPNLGGDSSPSDTPVPSDEEMSPSSSLLPNMIIDTGSDTDTDVSASIQKKLMDSVKRGNLRKVMANHTAGANLLETDQYGWTPLHHAARLDKPEVLKYIIENIPREGLDIVEDEKIQTALHKGAWYGHFEVCKLLVEAGASLTRKDYQGNDVCEKSVQSSNKVLQCYLQDKMKVTLATNEVAV